MSCCGSQGGSCSTENLFKIRVQQILRCLGGQFPNLFILADFWRQMVVSYNEDNYADNQVQQWVRLDEQVSVFFFEAKERFYQAETGIINQRTKYILSAQDLGLVAGDHVVIVGTSYFIDEVEQLAGISKLKLAQEKSNFIMPGRNVATYRIMGMRVRMA